LFHRQRRTNTKKVGNNRAVKRLVRVKGKTMTTHTQTAIELVEEHCEENITPASPAEALGLLHLHLRCLEAELAREEDAQEADNLLQALVAIAATAVSAATAYVLPAMEEGGAA
jgi:hypothetical protein